MFLGGAIPLLSKEGSPSDQQTVEREGGVVCSTSRSHLSDFREAFLIDRYATRIFIRSLRGAEQTAPAALRAATPPY